MEANSKVKHLSKLKKVDIYKAEMQDISFIAEYLDDFPEIFDVHSEKFVVFLVKTFTVLDPKFHYLSYVGNESIGRELAKAAHILRIYPYSTNQKSLEIFHNMSETEMHNFWMRFFKLCKMKSLYTDSNSLKKCTDSSAKGHNFLSDVNKTVQYFNYDMSVINPKKLNGVDVDKEIDSWVTSSFLESLSDSNVNHGNQVVTFEEKYVIQMDIENLISDIDYIKKKFDFENVNVTRLACLYKDFFKSFNCAVKIMKKYSCNVDFIFSFNMIDLMKNTKVHRGSYWLSNNCQIKRCNDIIQNILNLERIC